MVGPVLVKSMDNKADRLTRVPKQWLKEPACSFAAVADAEMLS